MNDLIEKRYGPVEVARLAIEEPNLRVAQLHQVLIAMDFSHALLRITPAEMRVADKRAIGQCEVPEGYHALDSYDRRNSKHNTEGMVGTEGIDCNPILEQVLAGIRMLFNREGRSTLVCGESGNTHCYARALFTGTHWADLTSEIDAVAMAYMPGAKGFLVHKSDGHALGFLPIEVGSEGNFGPSAWNFTPVPNARAVTGIPPRIQTARAVMVHIIGEDGNPAVVSYNLEMIGVGEIEEESRMRAPAGLVFRGFVSGEIAIVQNKAGRTIGDMEAGVHLVNLPQLERMFGVPARMVIGASTAFAS